MSLKMKRSPIPDARKLVCEPLAQELKDHLLEYVEEGKISLREAADIINGLQFAFAAMIKLLEADGKGEMLDRIEPHPSEEVE